MGYDVVHFSITGRLSRHNAPKDEYDDRAWERLRQEVRALILSDPDFRRVTGEDYEGEYEVQVDG